MNKWIMLLILVIVVFIILVVLGVIELNLFNINPPVDIAGDGIPSPGLPCSG